MSKITIPPGINETSQFSREDDVFTFFKENKSQIIFEFFYLLSTFFVAVFIVIATHFKIGIFAIDHHSKVLVLAAVGGFLGGWTFDAKWFYRVTAKGKFNQYPFKWEKHKFYWRILTPFVSGLVSFSIFMLVSADMLPISISNSESARGSFGLCFVMGYFSDLIMSYLAKWAESIILPHIDKK